MPACVVFCVSRRQLLAQTAQDPVARWNHPAWWLAKMQAEWPEQWQAILEANNAQAPMTLRVNIRRISVADYLKKLEAAGLAGQPSGLAGVVLQQASAVQQIPGFDEGLVSVQDSAAQWAAPLLLTGLQGQAPLAGARCLCRTRRQNGAFAGIGRRAGHRAGHRR